MVEGCNMYDTVKGELWCHNRIVGSIESLSLFLRRRIEMKSSSADSHSNQPLGSKNQQKRKQIQQKDSQISIL